MTAIEWLINEFELYYNGESELFYYQIIEKAKEVEKEQIIDAFVECWKANMPDGFECKLSAKQYYNETFKQ